MLGFRDIVFETLGLMILTPFCMMVTFSCLSVVFLPAFFFFGGFCECVYRVDCCILRCCILGIMLRF